MGSQRATDPASLRRRVEKTLFECSGNFARGNITAALLQPLDFETKRRYILAAEAVNERPDERFLPLGEFTDRTTLKVVVEDVDEPPVFLSPVYRWKLPENVAAGTVVGGVGARDVDATNKAVR